jgi:hypothetical protein
VYVDAAMLAFHVPTELSVSTAANVVVSAKAANAILSILRMMNLLSELSRR